MEGKPMTHYVTLYNFTEQGLKSIKDTVKRVEAAKKAAEAQGVRVKEVLWVEGQYDRVQHQLEPSPPPQRETTIRSTPALHRRQETTRPAGSGLRSNVDLAR